MPAGNMISVGGGGEVMKYTFIPTRIKRELVRSGVDCTGRVNCLGL